MMWYDMNWYELNDDDDDDDDDMNGNANSKFRLYSREQL